MIPGTLNIAERGPFSSLKRVMKRWDSGQLEVHLSVEFSLV